MLRPQILYCFLHIPKCAGTTFRSHIVENFNSDAYLSLNLGDRFFNLHTQSFDYFETENEIVAYLASLTKEQKSKIKIIFGHAVYYGVHEYFEQEPRYVTFVRSPESRSVSLYNHRRTVAHSMPSFYAWNESPHFKNFWLSVQKKMFVLGTPVTLASWVSEQLEDNYVFNLLKYLKFIRGTEAPPSQESLQEGVDRFYFIGLTERFDSEALYLFYLLGITKFCDDRNVTPTYHETLTEDVRGILAKKIETDSALYRLATVHNENFKRKHHFYSVIVGYMACRRMFAKYIDTMNPITRMYHMSAKMKKFSPFYAVCIARLKRRL